MMNIEKYIDELINNGLDTNHWFMTKQTMSDYFFPFYVGHVVDTYKKEHKQDQNFQKYYTYCFKTNAETRELFPLQSESENTYRNAIVAEFLGLIERHDSQYAHANATAAYKRLSMYIKKANDVAVYRDQVDRQIEKICLNVIESASKYQEVKSVTIFPAIFLYKILTGLYDKYKDSKLTYEEFSLFVMRAKSYSEYNQVIDLISQYRKHAFDSKFDIKIQKILNHQSTKNVRFDTLFGSLQHIEYGKNKYYRIKNDLESYQYMINVIKLYENSDISQTLDKKKLKEFMQSNKYFSGELDNVIFSSTITEEEFKHLIEEEDDFKKKIDDLASEYGEKGTTVVTSEVRLSAVQQAFRDKLIENHGQQCMLCKITNKEMLVASHIKDAAVCDIHEKADFNNGLLLCANHDKLFDRFLITFNFYDGKIQISKSLTEEEKKICMLNPEYILPTDLLTPERADYLMWHNEEFHKKEVER